MKMARIIGMLPMTLMVMVASSCFYNPAGSATDESGETGTPGTTAEDPPTTGTTDTTPTCDGDGECDPGEDPHNCPEDCEAPPSCGDGNVNGAEYCDDGADNGMYGHCDADCSGLLGCGDGQINGDEACDDGSDNSDEYSPSAHCNMDCSGEAPYCGDGVCQAEVEVVTNCASDCMETCGDGVRGPFEDCDDGDGDPADSALCNADCTIAACGDSYTNDMAGETCDDGDADETDECAACETAKCGDGYVQSGIEECDDGDSINDNECGNACILPRKVFVSSLETDGDIVGLAGADLFCQTLANATELTGTYRAWLSDATYGPADRFDTAFVGSYRLVGGTVIASNGWMDLSDGMLVNPINRTESGAQISRDPWTNTDPMGNPASTEDCDGWTVTSGSSIIGITGAVDMSWTLFDDTQFCSVPRSVYCFEDVP
jgi:hypothetical protein